MTPERRSTMDDNKILDLYWERSETAIVETSTKYGRYCRYIAHNILQNYEDSDECVNDTYLRAWNSIPPHRPNKFSAFLGKITRNLSLNMYEKNTTQKRGAGQIPLVLDELQGCVPSCSSVENAIDEIMYFLYNKLGFPMKTGQFSRVYYSRIPTPSLQHFLSPYQYIFHITKHPVQSNLHKRYKPF